MSTREVMVAGGRRGHAAAARPVLGGPWRQVPHLARVDAVRVLRHPALLVGLAWFLLGVGIDTGDTSPYDRYTMATGTLIFLMGIPAFVAVNMVATSGRRSGVDEWAAALPVPVLHRTVAMLLAALGPAVLVVGLSAGYLVLTPGETLLPVLWQHVAAQGAALLGAGLLGVTVARLLPWPGLPLLVAVGLVSANAWVSNDRPYLGPYTEFLDWTASDDVPARTQGSASWHLVYLLALGALAAAGALLPVARRRWLPFAAGAVAGSVVLLAGWLQLP